MSRSNRRECQCHEMQLMRAMVLNRKARTEKAERQDTVGDASYGSRCVEIIHYAGFPIRTSSSLTEVRGRIREFIFACDKCDEICHTEASILKISHAERTRNRRALEAKSAGRREAGERDFHDELISMSGV